MAEQFISDRNLKFLLYEMFNIESLLQYPRYADHSREVFDMVIETIMKLARDLFKPILHEMDQNQPEYVNGEVKVHPQVRTIMRECGAGGWIGASLDYEYGGQQLPKMVGDFLTKAVFAAANYSASPYPGLNNGVLNLLTSFCDKETQALYVPKLIAGEWQGTMALTEPQAGSSLADITLTGEPTDQGYYKMKGQKIFISGAEHNGVDNVVNMTLGRIKGAPAGIRGISLFIIPKRRIEKNGELVPNDVNCAGIYHKLGYRGCPITQLAFGENDDCRGWIVGEANKGLSYMFQMMNGSRIGVGMGAASIASAAYYASLEYAKERPQGRKLSSKDPLSPQVPIIEHPDIKRMLLFQKAVVEGSFSLLMQCGLYHDLEKVTEGEEQENYNILQEVLIPVCKSYPAEMGILSCSQGLQILGGYGYCDEFPLEQFYRDARIHPLHEGTTGITALSRRGAENNRCGPRGCGAATLRPGPGGRSRQTRKRDRPSGRYRRPGKPGTLPGGCDPLPRILRHHRHCLAVAPPGGSSKEGPGRQSTPVGCQFLSGEDLYLPLFLRLRTAQNRGAGHPFDQ